MRLLKSAPVIVLLGTLLYLGTTFWVLQPSRIGALTFSSASTSSKRITGASWEFFDPEVDRLIDELAQERLVLNERQQELDQLARRLAAERAELNQVTQAVHQLRMEFDRSIIRVKAEEASNLKRLAKTYSAMSPEVAASVLDELEEEQMVRLLMFMKEDQTAAIIENIARRGGDEVKRAATLSQRLRTAIRDDASSEP